MTIGLADAGMRVVLNDVQEAPPSTWRSPPTIA
jgi:hypothetical protein